MVLDYRILTLAESVERLAQTIERAQPTVEVGQMSTPRTWISGGSRFTWVVTLKDAEHPNETQAEYDARCTAEFAAQLVLHPMD